MAKTILLAFVSVFLVGAIILQPDTSFQASLQGLTIWWNMVFPGLLPFLVLYEIMLAFGLVHALGAMLQPAVQRLFKLPGEAALALVIGWFGGSPAGPEAAASLRKRSIVTRSEGQRLLAFSHMPNPLFMLVIVGAGFLRKPLAGIMIAVAVWLSALWLLTISSLFHRSRPDDKKTASAAASRAELTGRKSWLQHAIATLGEARKQDGRSFGKVLGDAVALSVQKLLAIGGFIIFSAVIAKLSEPLLAPLLNRSGLAFIGPALFESHLGAYAAALWEAPGSGSILNAAAIAGVLAWSGLSGILQAGYSMAGTDLRLLPFIGLRLVHAMHAFLFMLLLWKPLSQLIARIAPDGILPVLLPSLQTSGTTADFSPAITGLKAGDLPSIWLHSLAGCIWLSVALAAVYLVGRLIRLSRKHH